MSIFEMVQIADLVVLIFCSFNVRSVPKLVSLKVHLRHLIS